MLELFWAGGNEGDIATKCNIQSGMVSPARVLLGNQEKRVESADLDG